MLMKKIFILLMVGSLLFSCQITDVLNQEPPHNLTPDNAITDEKSAETALTGIPEPLDWKTALKEYLEETGGIE